MRCRSIVLLFVSISWVVFAHANRSLMYNPSCRVGDAECNCAGLPDGKYAEPRTNCSNYYWCSEGRSFYRECPISSPQGEYRLSFDNKLQTCNWPQFVKCEESPAPSPLPSPPSVPPPTPVSSPPPAPTPSPSPSPSPDSPPEKPAFSYAVYLDSRTDPQAETVADSAISKIPKYVTHLLLSFLRPDTTYPGGITFKGTGLRFSSDPEIIKGAIALLKEKNPHAKVLVSVGGFCYDDWDSLNAAAVASFVQTFGLDGVDIDYEPSTSRCALVDKKMRCNTDFQYISAIKALRAALPRPFILTNAAMNVGAYGEGDWQYAQPESQHTGISINPLRETGDDLDAVMLMSYDGGELYDPIQGVDAYSNYFKGDILLGVQVAPEAWGGHVISNSTLDGLTRYVRESGTAGLMLWHAYKLADPGTPTSNQISGRICNNLGLDDCETPLVEQ